MKKLTVIVIIVIGLAGIIASFWIPAANAEVNIRSKVIAQQEVCKASADNMWKILKEQASVTDEYKDAFMKIYPELIDGRYANDKGLLMKWVQESNPDFKIELYENLMNSIAAERTKFNMNQNLLIDINREHWKIRHTFPGSIFIGRRPDIKITIITSSKTKAMYETGEENDVELFKKAK